MRNLIDFLQQFNFPKARYVILKRFIPAFGYNTLEIPVAIFGGPPLNPMLAAATMSLSSVSVLVNILRLKRFKPNQ